MIETPVAEMTREKQEEWATYKGQLAKMDPTPLEVVGKMSKDLGSTLWRIFEWIGPLVITMFGLNYFIEWTRSYPATSLILFIAQLGLIIFSAGSWTRDPPPFLPEEPTPLHVLSRILTAPFWIPAMWYNHTKQEMTKRLKEGQ